MNVYTLLIFFLLPVLGHCQISNGSFEDCSSPSDPTCTDALHTPGGLTCTGKPNAVTQFEWVSGWKSLCSADWFCEGAGFYYIDGVTADRFCSIGTTIHPHSGTHYVGIYNEEAIIYDFGAQLAEGFYRLKFWTNSCKSAWKIRVFGANGLPEKGSDCDISFGSSKKYELLNTARTNQNNWEEVVVDFDTYGKDIRNIVITGDRTGYGCSGYDYFFIDDVSLDFEACCPTHKLFQFYDVPSSITEVSDRIDIGENVGAPGPTGEVHILAGQTVVMRAGNAIMADPGFNPAPGSFVDLHPIPCSDDHSNYQECNFAPIATPNTAVVTCNATDLGLTFISVGCATGYEAEIYDRFGETGVGGLKYGSTGPIYTQVVSYSNGFPLSFPTSGTTYLVHLRLFNCEKDTNIEFTINPILTGDCPSKTDIYETSIEVDSIENNSYINIYPNPATSILSVEYTAFANESARILCIDNLGKEINLPILYVNDNKYINKKLSNFNISLLSQGTYFLNIIINKQRYVRKFVVIR